MSVKTDHSAKNAMRALYLKKYELDRRHDFRLPRLKVDVDAYLNILLQAVDAAFDEANVVKFKGHTLSHRGKAEAEKDELDD